MRMGMGRGVDRCWVSCVLLYETVVLVAGMRSWGATSLSLLGKGNWGEIQDSTGNSHQSLSQVSTLIGTTGL